VDTFVPARIVFAGQLHVHIVERPMFVVNSCAAHVLLVFCLLLGLLISLYLAARFDRLDDGGLVANLFVVLQLVEVALLPVVLFSVQLALGLVNLLFGFRHGAPGSLHQFHDFPGM